MKSLPPRLWLLTFAHFSIDAYSSFFSPLLPLLVQKLDLSLGLVGTLVALSSLSSSFSQPLFGMLSDRMRRPWFLALGPLFAAVFMSAIGLAPSYAALIALLTLAGLGVAAFHPQGAVLAGEASDRRGIAMSVFVTGGTLGFSVGPIVAVTIAARFGLERTWIAMIPGVVVGIVLLAWVARLAPHAHTAHRGSDLAGLRPVARPLALLYGAVVTRSAVSYGFLVFLSLYLTGRGFSVERAGHMVAAYLLLGALGGFFGGWLADRWGGRRVVLWSFVAAIPLYVSFLLLPPGPGLVSLVLGAFVLQTSTPVNVVLGQELSPRHASTISSLLMGAAWGVGALLIGPLGVFADHFGLHAGLLLLSTLLVAGAAFAAALPPARGTLLPVAGPAAPVPSITG